MQTLRRDSIDTMQYVIAIEKRCQVRQGLASPVRGKQGATPVVQFDVVVRAGVAFDESQLTGQGWFVDTDAAEMAVAEVALHLASAKWTELFDFRPTFELVARWAFRHLEPRIPQVAFVELNNITLNVCTCYSKSNSK